MTHPPLFVAVPADGSLYSICAAHYNLAHLWALFAARAHQAGNHDLRVWCAVQNGIHAECFAVYQWLAGRDRLLRSLEGASS